MRGRVIVLCTFLGSASGLLAATTGRQQYILMFQQPNASAAPSIVTDVQLLGGSVDAQGSDRLMVSLPDPAVAAVRQHPGVHYLQRAAIGTQPVKTPVSTSVGTNGLKPQPQSTRLRPKPLWNSDDYSYDGAGNITNIGTTSSFSYDSLSRLTAAALPGHSETYQYDGFGNLRQRVSDTHTFTSVVDANNHLVFGQTVPYDAAGNLTQNESNTEQYEYDPFNNLRKKNANGTSEIYVYDANDERIGARAGPDRWLWSLRDESGRVLRQYESFENNPHLGWTWIEDYVYRDGQLLGAEREAEEGGRRHFHLDHLGTPRLITSTGGQIVSAHDYFPFGVEITPLNQEGTFSREEPMKFTGHERDFTSGTAYSNDDYFDYMHARHGSPGWGRFLSVDPSLGNIYRPQSWNQYAYVENNPLNRTDPSGDSMKCVTTKDGERCEVTPDGPPPPTESELMFLARLTRPIAMPGMVQRAARGDEFAQMIVGNVQGVVDPVAETAETILRVLLDNGNCGKTLRCGTVTIGNLTGPAGESLVGHIFRSAPGHVNPSTLASQGRFVNLFESVANNPANLRQGVLPQAAEAVGVRMYTQNFANGQVWVMVRGNTIINAGVNAVGSFR